jgi:hypothetical protein
MMEDLIYATAALSAVSRQDGGGMQSILDESLPGGAFSLMSTTEKWYRLQLPLSWLS